MIGTMTDEEVICTWMQPKPLVSIGALCAAGGSAAVPKWWEPHWELAGEWQPISLSLDLLWEVEERLVQMKNARWVQVELQEQHIFWIWHATAEQRIQALAVVLRPLVEAAELANTGAKPPDGGAQPI